MAEIKSIVWTLAFLFRHFCQFSNVYIPEIALFTFAVHKIQHIRQHLGTRQSHKTRTGKKTYVEDTRTHKQQKDSRNSNPPYMWACVLVCVHRCVNRHVFGNVCVYESHSELSEDLYPTASQSERAWRWMNGRWMWSLGSRDRRR